MEGGDQIVEALPEVAALIGGWERFLADGRRAKVLAEFIEHGTKASDPGD